MKLILSYGPIRIFELKSFLYLFINHISGGWLVLRTNEDMTKEHVKSLLNGPLSEIAKQEKLFVENYKIVEQDIFHFEGYPNTLRIEFPYCNMRCKYCYFIKDMKNVEMKITPKEVLNFCRRTDFTRIQFHGGEPLLFFSWIKSFVSLAKRENIKFKYEIQTNGTLINDEIVAFFKENNISVGVSLDGPGFVHDVNRVFPDGSGSFDLVMKGIELLKKHRVNFNILSTLTRELINYKEEVFSFMKRLNVPVQLNIPIFKGGYSKQDISLKELENFFIWYLEKYSFDFTMKDICTNAGLFGGNKKTQIINGKEYALIKSNCGAGATTLVVDYEGKLSLCQSLPKSLSPGTIYDSVDNLKKNVKNLRKKFEFDRLSFIMNSNDAFSSVHEFGCPGRSFFGSGSFLRKDPFVSVCENIFEKILSNPEKFYNSVGIKRLFFNGGIAYFLVTKPQIL